MTVTDFVRVGTVDDFEPGVLYDRQVDGLRVVVVRHGERIYAMRNACTHWGYFITPGKLLDDGSVLCPAHGAVFRLEDGAVGRSCRRGPFALCGQNRWGRRLSSTGRRPGT